MSRRSQAQIAIAALLLLATSLRATAAAEKPTFGREVGQMHPQIVLPDLSGKKTLALSQFRGRKLLLIEFASW